MNKREEGYLLLGQALGHETIYASIFIHNIQLFRQETRINHSIHESYEESGNLLGLAVGNNFG